MDENMSSFEYAEELMRNHGKELIAHALDKKDVGDYVLTVGSKDLHIRRDYHQSTVGFTVPVEEILEGADFGLREIALEQTSIENKMEKTIRYVVTPTLLKEEFTKGWAFPRTAYAWDNTREISADEKNLLSLRISTHLHATVWYRAHDDFQRDDSQVHKDSTILDENLPRSLMGVRKLPYLGQDIRWTWPAKESSEEIVKISEIIDLVELYKKL